MIVTQAINVHLDKQSTPTIETVQSDTGRTVTANLFNQGAPWEPPAGATGMVRHSILHEGESYTSAYDSLSDGTVAVTFSGSQMTIHLSPEILSIPGVGELQVGILHNDVLVATMTMLLRVQRNIGTQGLTPNAYTDLSHHIQNELVRQFRNVYDQGSWLENLHHRVSTDYIIGGIDSDGNLDTSRTSTICSDMIYHGGREVSVAFPAGIKVRCLFYDGDYNYTAETLFFEQSFTIYSPQTYMRLEVGYEDDGRVQDPQWLAAQVGIFYSDDFQGRIGALAPKSFRQCTDAGYYQFSNADLQMLSDAPDISTGGILEVIPHGDNDVIFQRLWTSDGQLWFRKGSAPFRQLNAKAVFTVTYADDCIDKSFAEIRAAIDAGMVVQCSYQNELMPLAFDDGDVLRFAVMDIDHQKQVTIHEDDTAELTVRPDVATTQFIRMCAYADGTVDIDYIPEGLWNCMDSGGTLPAVLLTGDDIMGEIWLPFVQAYYSTEDNQNIFVFSKDIPVDGKAKRYTIKLSVDDQIAELLVEELHDTDVDLSGYYTKSETDTAIADAIADMGTPSTNGGLKYFDASITTEAEVIGVEVELPVPIIRFTELWFSIVCPKNPSAIALMFEDGGKYFNIGSVPAAPNTEGSLACHFVKAEYSTTYFRVATATSDGYVTAANPATFTRTYDASAEGRKARLANWSDVNMPIGSRFNVWGVYRA